MSTIYLKNVIVTGAGGQIGSEIFQALLSQGKHNVTALTRPESESTMPEGLHNIVKADYNQHDELVAAMKGQDALVITMNAMAPPESSFKLIDAAADAGIKYIVPNEWGTDREQVQLGKDLMLAEGQIKVSEYIQSKGLKWISVGCGFWYEFSLSGTEQRFGFDFANRTATFYDQGTTKITVSTWKQTALAVARILALPLTSPTGTSLFRFENQQVLVSSFYISQQDMFESILRVTGDKPGDWTITREHVKARFGRGQILMQQGDFVNGFTISMYARAFFDEDPLNHESKVENVALSLPKEELDAATALAIQMAREGAAKSP